MTWTRSRTSFAPASARSSSHQSITNRRRRRPLLPGDRFFANPWRDRRSIAVGVFVGPLMAESQDAMDAIKQINEDWLAGKLSR
jgi:hypothetical protein